MACQLGMLDPGCQGRGSKFGIFSAGCASRLARELLRTRWGPGDQIRGGREWDQISWESKGSDDHIPPKCHTFAKKLPALLLMDFFLPPWFLKNPLVRPYFLGGWHRGGVSLDSHDTILREVERKLPVKTGDIQSTYCCNDLDIPSCLT